MLRAGFEPATCRLGVDNRTRSGPQQVFCRGREVQSDCGVEPHGREAALTWITEPLRPATADPPGLEPGPARLELAVLPVTPRIYACARLDSNQRPLPSQGSTLLR
jgi:hypothetical protein